MNALWSKLVCSLRAFRTACTGNIAITFAFATVPIVGTVGFAVDYSHANAVKAAMQAALDSTALMLSKDAATMSNGDLQTKAKNYFETLFTRPDAKIITISATYTATGGSKLVVTGAAAVPADFLGMVGFQNINVNGSATAAWGSTRLRVALALDNTGSMASDGKMTALKAATKSLLTQLNSAAAQNGDVHVSIIPFSRDVNVESSNYNASWIDWSGWEETRGSCNDNHYDTKTSCLSHLKIWTANNHNTWNGCITDRGPSGGSPGTSTWDQVATVPDGTANSKWPAEQYNSCPVAMMGLSYNWTAMNSLIDSMQPSGSTNQPIGLVWAWQSLVGGGPLSVPAKDPNYQYRDAIILMSDGLNTQNRWFSSQDSVDNRMYLNGSGSGTCANIKNSGITIYTVQVNTSGDPISILLQNCAGSPNQFIDSSKFYMVTTAGGLASVFSAIGTNLTKLRVAK